MKKLNPIILVGSTVVIALVMTGLAMMSLGVTEDAIKLSLRETARLSLFLFLLVFVTAPLHQLLKNSATKWLMIHRRYLGISFGASHLIHLILIIWLIVGYSDGDLLSLAPLDTYLVGGIAYIFIIAMLITSNNHSITRLGHQRWKRLHRYGMNFIYFTFLISYAGLLEVDMAFYLPFLGLILLAALVRIFASVKNSKK